MKLQLWDAPTYLPEPQSLQLVPNTYEPSAHKVETFVLLLLPPAHGTGLQEEYPMYVQRYGPQPQVEKGIDDPLALAGEVVVVVAVASVDAVPDSLLPLQLRRARRTIASANHCFIPK